MRFVIQRVRNASVAVDDISRGSIDHGLLIYVGIEEEDRLEDVEWMTKKALQIRIFSDKDGKMNESVLDQGGGCLLISQFTLFASTKKGNRPSFLRSAKPDTAEPLFDRLAEEFRTHLGSDRVETGVFGAHMDVKYINDGPVTIMMDSKNKE